MFRIDRHQSNERFRSIIEKSVFSMIVTQVAGEGSFATHKYGQEKGGRRMEQGSSEVALN